MGSVVGEEMREFLTCPVCGRCITGKNCRQNLRHHLLIHTGAGVRGSGEAVICPVCGKSISGRNKRQNLQYHMITHTAHKPFKCPYCLHRANRSDNLKMHIRTRHFGHVQSHGVDSSNVARPMEGPGAISNEVPLLCFVCSKAFYGRNKRQHLTNHLSTHTGEKPYGCPFCPHRSSRKDNLKMHIKLRHLNNLPSSMLGGDVTPRYQGHEGVLCGSTPRHKGCSNVPSLSQVLRWEEQETASALPHDDSHWGEALPLSSLSTPS
ncbi:hypothetical protein Pmani_018743 [Petrolisthes manimaculis]|uniref:C2H2-type domain-containing protein n=1 Tax=Petrolisthes manimaculis TaxID=1843537 RepID=A0AAE1U4M0_9EUCA|nr:hypothetical protein Pmani_018743 [Petrolisthes manimaculis]